MRVGMWRWPAYVAAGPLVFFSGQHGLRADGDSVCTTTPNFGRGIATSLLQAREVLRLLDEHGTDVDTVAESFDSWAGTHMRPWVEDHLLMDDSLARRWAGEDVDLTHTRRVP